MMWRWIFAVVLLISLGGNAYLWLTYSSAQAKTTAAADERKTARTTRPRRLPKIEPLLGPAAKAQPYKGLDRSSLEQRLLKTEARIADLLPADEKFARDARSTETEAIVKPYLDRIFKAQPGAEARYHVECHGRVCKLETKRPWDEWGSQLQSTFPEAGWFCRMTFSDETYIELCKPDMLGSGLYRGITIAFHTAEQTKACVAGSSARGALTLRVRFDLATPRLGSEVSGSLASHAVGRCLRTALDEILSRTLIPPGVTSFPDVPIEVQLPPGPTNGAVAH